MFNVKLKAGHPTGIYHRAGIEFNARDVVTFENSDPKVKTLKADPWLEVSEVKPEQPPVGPFDGLTVEQLKQEAVKRTIELPGGLKKAEIIELLVKHDAEQQ